MGAVGFGYVSGVRQGGVIMNEGIVVEGVPCGEALSRDVIDAREEYIERHSLPYDSTVQVGRSGIQVDVQTVLMV